jgi:hypothetical protein
MATDRGMVTVGGVCYRIQKVSRDSYNVYRILDDAFMGTFERNPRITVVNDQTPTGALFDIASAAVRNARVSWMGRLDLP